MGEKEDYLTSYRVFFETFAATVNPEDQLPVNIAGYTITESELPGEVLYWITQYLTEKQCPLTLMTPLRRIILDEVRIASKKYPNDFGYRAEEGVYIALRLMQAVTARVNDVCLRYLDNSRLDSLPPPPPLAQRDFKTVSCATKNSRRVMEDRHVEIGNLEALFGIDTTEPTSFYAVYDGHAGSAAATYCAAHLHQYLVESPHFTTDLRKAMKEAFLRTDAEFIRKSNQERACGGSTAVAVTVRGRKLLAAWAGDSLALLANRMRLMQLVRPHKPSREDEKDRVEASGGSVIYWGTWRVNGQLAVSRAIGDAQYKPYVTARPEITTVDLDGDEDFVVVACDGLWDFVSEDDVALSIYRQLAADPDDLKTVTKRLIVQAKRQGSADNISIIVVFLKDPRDIAADNRPPMDLGLDNALANVPPFASETEACKRQADAAAVAADVDAEADADGEVADNGIDNSDSDSEDLGPETAVDADDVDAERIHEPAPPTPPAHTVEAGHVDGALVDNVAESGDESEDEWNYFKGEGEREHIPADEPDIDEPPRSDTPVQDNSAWESSSVDMNSSPLNPDAPVFVPGSVGTDMLLAESPRKPQPMDDIELPDVAQFQTEAVIRPAELLDLDNCDQLNGHHNISKDDTTEEHLNGNDKCTMDSLGFGFNVGIEPDKVKDSSLIQDFERIQKDTTDFCNIQVFQSHTETNLFADETNDELFERLKNKERDPMSMSFYQEKDDDTCERLPKVPPVDLNAVQPLPDSDDDDMQQNGDFEDDKENVFPEDRTDPFAADREPNNDIIRFDDRTDNFTGFGPDRDNIMNYDRGSDNSQYPNIEFDATNVPQDTVMQTDTPESHKLLFEQIPEIPDGKSSELGFANDYAQDPESEKDLRAITPQDETSHDIEMESKLDDSQSEELRPESIQAEFKDDDIVESKEGISHAIDQNGHGFIDEAKHEAEDRLASPAPVCEPVTPEPAFGREDVSVDVHHEQNEVISRPDSATHKHFNNLHTCEIDLQARERSPVPPEITLNEDAACSPSPMTSAPALSQSPTATPLSPSPTPPCDEALVPREPAHTGESPLPTTSPAPREASPIPAVVGDLSPPPVGSPTVEHFSNSPLPPASPALRELSPLPATSPALRETSPLPAASPAPRQPSPLLAASPAARELSPLPAASPIERDPSPFPVASPVQRELSPLPAEITRESPLPTLASLPRDSPLSSESPIPTESPLPIETSSLREDAAPEAALNHIELAQSPQPTDEPLAELAIQPADVPLPSESPALTATLRLQSPTPPAVEPESRIETLSLAQVETTNLEFDQPPEAAIEAVEMATFEMSAPVPAAEMAEEAPLAAPAPDLVPEPRAELVTDVDLGVPEARAQEICVPVTSEIRAEDGEQRPTATPPPTPAVEPSAVPAPAELASAAAAAVAITGAIAAAAAVAATEKKSTLAPTKKSPTTPTAKPDARTPKSAPRSTTGTPRTPTSAGKRPAPAPAARTLAAAPRAVSARAPTAAKPAAPAPPKPIAAKAAAAPRAAPVKAAAPARPAASASLSKPPARTSAPSAPRPAPAAARAAPAPRPAAPRAPVKAAAPKPTAATSSGRPAPRPATAPSARPAPRPTTAPAPATKPKKPLTNGDAKESKPVPRPVSGAPRPAPRAPASAPAPAPPAPRSAAPRTTTARAALDKQSKDLVNKRITAKAAPPRTAATKAPLGTKSTVSKVGPKKSIESAKTTEVSQNGLTNGCEGDKAPPSPPPADNALLPDVIA